MSVLRVNMKQTTTGSLAGVRGLAPVAARAVQGALRANFSRLSGEKSSRWWGKAVQATRIDPSETRFRSMVFVDQPGVALHLHGGVVRPVNGVLLALPANERAKRKAPLEFTNLRAIIFPRLCGASGRLAGMLVQEPNEAQKRRFGANKRSQAREARRRSVPISLVKAPTAPRPVPFFWLMTSTVHQPNPEVLPTDGELMGAIDRVLGSRNDAEVER